MEEKLKKLLAENKVIPFVGAGVSKAVTNKNGKNVFLNWEELLIELSNSETLSSEHQNVIKALLSVRPINYLQIADFLADYLTTNDFNKELKNIFSIDYNDIDKNTLELAKIIWELNSNLVITTNYDKVLSIACQDKNINNWDIESVHEQGNSLRDGVKEPTIWHLHGHVGNINNIILTTQKYNELYSNNISKSRYKSALETLRNIISSKSLLFIGFSLDDDFFVKQLKRTIEIFGGNAHEHYILVKKGSSTDTLDGNIKVIEYKDYGQPLIDKIRSLKPERTITTINNTPQVVKEDSKKNQPIRLTSLPAKKDDFIGRVAELKDLEERLEKSGLVYVVNGIGGVGKSELSIKYLHDNLDNYNSVAFLELTENQSLEELFITKFKEPLQLPEGADFDTAIRYLQNRNGKNLMIIDNLVSKEDYEKLKPLNNSFNLLITTRTKTLDVSENNRLNLDILNDEDAKKLFLSIYNEDDTIEDILEYLDNHPLFINLIAKSLKQKYITLKDLRETIAKGEISKIDAEDDKTFNQHLHKTFNKQFETEANEDLKEFLQLLSILPPVEIEFSVFEKVVTVDKLKVKLAKLVERGWLIQKGENYKLHQIIKTFILDNYVPDFNKISFVLDNIGDFLSPEDSKIIANHYIHYIPIIDSILTLFKNIENEQIAKLLDSLTFLYYVQGQYDESLFYQKNSHKIREEIFGKDGEKTAINYNLLGIIFDSKGEYDNALLLFEKALNIREEIFGENHPNTATSYNNLAGLFESKGEYDKALPLFEKALNIREEIFGENHPDTATSYSNLAGLFESKGEYDKALPLFEKALNIREEIFGENHPDTATSYSNLAGLFNSKGEYDKALPLFEKALNIREEIFGENHPDTATSYNNLAGLFNSKGEYDKALPLYEKDLKICEETFGENHPNTATSYNNLAGLFNSKGEYDKALPLHEKALNIREEIFGENHPDTATSYSNLAGLFNSKGEYDKALPLFEKALNIREEIFGENHPDTATSYNNLAGLFNSKGEYDKALPLYEKDLKICEETFGENHPNTATSYNNLAGLFNSKGEYDKALPLHEKALNIREEIFGENHPNTATSYNNLGLLLSDLKQCQKAKDYIIKALSYFEDCGFENKRCLTLRSALRKIESNIKKQQKAGYKKKGKYCID